MKKKEDVYLVVDTQKKAKKLQKVLDMFGIKFHKDQFHKDQSNYVIFYFDDDSRLYSTESSWLVHNKQKVSIKELRNILAVEKLKEGDVVVCEDDGDTVIGIYKGYDEFGFYLDNPYYLNDPDYISFSGGGCFDNFIRYATEEEKALLEPVKIEYKDKTWYKKENGVMFFLDKSKEHHYGFLCGSEWYEEIQWFKNYEVNNFHVPGVWQEATTEEVKQALVKEAEKRYKVGDKVKSLVPHIPVLSISEFKFNQFNEISDLWVRCDNNTKNALIFRNGKWAEVLPQTSTTEITDKDIATLERLHDTLADAHGYSLEFELMKSARVLAEKLRELSTKTK